MSRTTLFWLWITLMSVGTLVSSESTAAAPAVPRTDGRTSHSSDGWPETREGEIASRWVVAFSSGDSAMRAFLGRDMARESLAKRGIDDRMETYRDARDRFGKLVLASVVKSIPGELTVKLMASDASVKDYVFTVQTKAPFQLISVGRLEQRMQHGGFGGFHH